MTRYELLASFVHLLGYAEAVRRHLTEVAELAELHQRERGRPAVQPSSLEWFYKAQQLVWDEGRSAMRSSVQVEARIQDELRRTTVLLVARAGPWKKHMVVAMPLEIERYIRQSEARAYCNHDLLPPCSACRRLLVDGPLAGRSSGPTPMRVSRYELLMRDEDE